MPKLKDFLTALAKKAGYDTESPTAKPFFDGLPDTDIPDDIQKGVDNSLISIKDAKNNHPEIRNFYFKQNMDGMDKAVLAALGELGIDPEALGEEVNTIESPFKRVNFTIKKIAELEKAKSASTNPKDKALAQKEIDELHKQLAAEKINREKDKKDFEGQFKGLKISNKLAAHLSAFKTIHDELDPDVKSTVINTLLQKELQDNQAKFDLDENGNVVLLKNDGTNYYGENHQQVTPGKFIEQTLAKTKQLKVSSPAPNGANNSNGGYQRPQVNGQPDKNPNAAVIEQNNLALEQIKAAATTNGKY